MSYQGLEGPGVLLYLAKALKDLEFSCALQVLEGPGVLLCLTKALKDLEFSCTLPRP